jgi:acyl-homoserine-lactone acylase
MKTRSRSRRWICLAATVLLVSACAPSAPDLPGQGDDAGRTVVYRDTWGVPHIYAPTAADGLYAMGYAQAEDRPEQLLQNLLIAIGELSSVAGEAGIQSDLRSHMWDHYGVGKRSLGELRPELQRHIEAFAAGINDFFDQHPADRPAWWGDRRVDAAMIIAFGRLFLYNWSIDEAYGDLRRGGIEPGFEPPQRGSNQFAVAPSRSAEGAAILAIDPHLAWFGPSRFWEFRIHAGDLEGSGVTLAGSPYIGLGHTRYLAWAMTTGGPDTADVYELTVDDADPHRYLYDGEWRAMTSREVTLEVQGSEPQTHTLWFSHHGPIIAARNGRAYAARMSYADVGATNEAWYELNFGKDYQGAVRAMETGVVFPQNIMVADTSGNIYYQRTGRVPVRPDGFDWSVPVDGSTVASEWLGVHPASDHLQVLNPPQGYMQNCNIPPDAMMVDSPFSLESIRPYIYGSHDYGPLEGWTNQRGARAVELLSQDDSVTAEEAIAYITDVHPYGVDRWIAALTAAHESFGETLGADPDYASGIADVLSWDGQLRADSSSALKYDAWRHQLFEDLGRDRISSIAAGIDDWYAPVRGERAEPIEVDEEAQRAMVASFATAMKRLVEDYGTLGAVYGQRYRVGRDEASWPTGGGGDRSSGTTTLRNVGYGEERADHTRWGRSGQTSTQVVVMSDPPRSWIYLPIGESDRPDSPHYDDQAEKLFAQRRLKPSWWLPEDLAGNIESRLVLEHPESPGSE